MTDDPTTDRAQRQQAVSIGAASDAVDRASRRLDPRTRTAEPTIHNRGERL